MKIVLSDGAVVMLNEDTTLGQIKAWCRANGVEALKLTMEK